MSKEETPSNFAYWLNTETEQMITDGISKYVIIRNTESNNDESDEEHIPKPVFLGLIANFLIKIKFEVSEITAAILDIYQDKHEALSIGNGFGSEGFSIKKNSVLKPYDAIQSSEIYEIISKNVDDLTNIAKYFNRVMETFIAVEIDKCLPVRKTESINDERYREYVYVSILPGFMDALLIKFSSNMTTMMASMIGIEEATYNYIKASYIILTEEERNPKDMLKQLENPRIERLKQLENRNNDWLKQLEKYTNLLNSITQQMVYKDDEDPEKQCSSGIKKGSSIICKFVNRNKKYEILSTRKQLRGKRRDPLP